MLDGSLEELDALPNGAEAVRAGLWLRLGADGVYARRGQYETVVEALAALLSRHRPPQAEVLRFPPVMSRDQLQRAGYLKSFPHLLGCVSCLGGGESKVRGGVDALEAGRHDIDALDLTDLVLTPAACYPVYPLAAERGPVGAAGLLFDVACDCFRREPSADVDRMQSFRMREFVCIGTAAQTEDFRGRWIGQAKALAHQLGLPHHVEAASDPFFGRGAPLMAMSQIEQSLKFELLIPIRSQGGPTACMSFNNHQDHFADVWDLRGAAGEACHTACVAFGMDRLALALFSTHGLHTNAWPHEVRQALRL